MKKEDYHEKWCPMGRLSLQHSNNKGDIQVIPGGAFNSVLYSSSLNSNDGGKPYLSSMCIGEQCPMYRKALLPWRWGRCAFSHDNSLSTLMLALVGAGVLGIFCLMLAAFWR